MTAMVAFVELSLWIECKRSIIRILFRVVKCCKNTYQLHSNSSMHFYRLQLEN